MTQALPPPDPSRAVVVVPTYNEMEMLLRISEAVLALKGWRLLVVDDNSPDGTGQLADEIAGREPRVSVLHRAAKEGLGPAYLAGFAECLKRPDVEFVFEMDADFSHDPADLPRLLEAARDADLVIGSRYVRGGRTEGWGLRRRLLSQWGNVYVRLVLGIPVRDATAGFRCWRRRALEAVDFSAVSAKGYGFQIEMAYRTVKAGFRVIEVPICFAERRAGKSKL